MNLCYLRFIDQNIFSIEMNSSNSAEITIHLKNNRDLHADILTFLHCGFPPSCARFEHYYYPF